MLLTALVWLASSHNAKGPPSAHDHTRGTRLIMEEEGRVPTATPSSQIGK